MPDISAPKIYVKYRAATATTTEATRGETKIALLTMTFLGKKRE